MRSDSDIKRDVEDELRWDPDVDATDIAVTVKSGIVTLAGFTRSYSDKLEAEAAAKRVAGVLGVANDIEVRLPNLDQRPDPEIARDAIAAIKSRVPVVAEQVKVLVRNGWITLEGGVEWDYQRSAIEGAVRRVKGLKGVTNTIRVEPRVPASEIKRKIEEAFHRSAEVDANRITIEAHEGEVKLRGAVRSWAERQEAERVALVHSGREAGGKPNHHQCLNLSKGERAMASRSLMPFSRNMPLSRWSEDSDPFLQMRREMNRLFDDAFSGFGLPSIPGPTLRQMPAAPKIDVSETDNEIQIKAEMPGIDQNDVEVLLEDDRLIIRGEKKEEREDQDRNYYVRERVQGAFSRTLPLPFAPEPNQVKAEFKDGVMTITIPKPQEVKQKQHRIEVQKDTSAPSEPTVSRAGAPQGSTSSTTSQSSAEQRDKATAAD